MNSSNAAPSCHPVFPHSGNRESDFPQLVLENLSDYLVTQVKQGKEPPIYQQHYKKLQISNREMPKIKEWVYAQFQSVRFDENRKPFQILGFMPKNIKSKYSYVRVMAIQESKTGIVDIILCGEENFVEWGCAEISAFCTPVTSIIYWVYNKYFDILELPLEVKNLPIQSMYPWLREPLESYYRRFMASNSNVLICIGPPGTGKTTFIRGMLHMLGLSATLSYERDIFNSDEFMVNFLSSSSSVFILEDADTLMTPRQDGNTSMERFLNASDGLIATQSKKLVFSTNLPTTRNIDDALLRAGRCFDVCDFRRLEPPEIDQLTADLGRGNYPHNGVSHTMAEVLTYRHS